MSNEDMEYGEYYKRFYDIWEKSMVEALDIWKKNLGKTIEMEGDKSIELNTVEYYKKFYETWEKTTSEALEKYIAVIWIAHRAGDHNFSILHRF